MVEKQSTDESRGLVQELHLEKWYAETQSLPPLYCVFHGENMYVLRHDVRTCIYLDMRTSFLACRSCRQPDFAAKWSKGGKQLFLSAQSPPPIDLLHKELQIFLFNVIYWFTGLLSPQIDLLVYYTKNFEKFLSCLLVYLFLAGGLLSVLNLFNIRMLLKNSSTTGPRR